MSYDDPLSEAEFARFSPNSEVVRYLELARHRLGLARSEMNVLDWGSGRGEYVVWLRDDGYNAFGAEIRKEAAERGRSLIEARGHDYDRVIRAIDPNGQTHLPADFFHFVFTHYVLEHVANLDAVTREIARVTAPGGCGFHVYPGKLRPIEPRWDWLSAASLRGKIQAYHDFCMDETFYRPYRQVRESFSKRGFVVTPVSADHPSLRRLAILPPAARKLAVELPVMLFQTVEILVRKSPDARAMQLN